MPEAREMVVHETCQRRGRKSKRKANPSKSLAVSSRSTDPQEAVGSSSTDPPGDVEVTRDAPAPELGSNMDFHDSIRAAIGPRPPGVSKLWRVV